jgi:hypothetical protein
MSAKEFRNMVSIQVGWCDARVLNTGLSTIIPVTENINEYE